MARALHRVAAGFGQWQQTFGETGHPMGQTDEANTDDDVERQVEQHHGLRGVGYQRAGMFEPQADKRRHQHHAQRLEHQVAQGDLAHGDGRFGGGEHGQHAAAQVGAQHQAQSHVQRHHAGAGHGRDQQHDGQAGIGQHRQQRAHGDLQQQVAVERGEHSLHSRG